MLWWIKQASGNSFQLLHHSRILLNLLFQIYKKLDIVQLLMAYKEYLQSLEEILVLHSICHLGQRLSLFLARAGLDIQSPAMRLQRSGLDLGRAGAAAHSPLLTAAFSNVGMLSDATKPPRGNGDFHLQDMVDLQAGVPLESN